MSKTLKLCLLTLAMGLGITAFACQVPVFRYALERWQADPYEVVVIPATDRELTAEEEEIVTLLEGTDEVMANLAIRVDPSAAGSAPTTQMAIYYPQKIRGVEVSPIWRGDFTMENARKLIDSPLRRELVTRILRGDSAVWVMVESGNLEKDDSAAISLSEFSGKAGEILKIPDGVVSPEEASAGEFVGNPDNILQSSVPLKIGFSSVRVSRTDPAEEIFLAMLLNLEDDLGEFEAEPMVFPVFGRGRILEPLIGKGITEDNAMDYAGYLCGACSCEVKDQNPGMDLLITANWDSAIAGSEVMIDKVLPPLLGTADLMHKGSTHKGSSTSQKAPTQQEPEAGSDEAAGGGSPLRLWSQVIGAVLCAIVLGGFILKLKGGGS